jgi:uncharacterized delta-60 repeat protein
VRFNTNGMLDTTFGSGGEVLTSFSVGSTNLSITSRGVVVTSTGQIVAVGDNGSDYVLARYNVNGSLDSNFGQGGKVITALSSGTYEENLAQQPDGKLVVAGETGSVRTWQVVRYNANGALDSTFGTGGVVNTSVSSVAMSVVIYPATGTGNDGKIVVAGYGNPTGFAQVFELARFNPDGSADNTWGGSGLVTISTSSANNSAAYAVAIQSDGKVVAAGRSKTGNDFQFALTRHNTDGSLDSAFGSGGIVTTSVGGGSDNLYGMALQSNGNIVVAGSASDATKGHSDFAAARYIGTTTSTRALTPTATTTAADAVFADVRAVAILLGSDPPSQKH